MLTYDAKNVINGTYGEIWCDSDYLAEAIGLEAKITLDKSEVNMCRKLSKGYKVTGSDGKGTLKMNKVSSYFIRKLGDAIKAGKTPTSEIITSLKDPDKRCKNIYLTEKAFDIQKKMESDRKRLDKRLTIGMTKKEVDVFRRGLETVLYNISEP